MTVYLSLGTNLGDREKKLSSALAELDRRLLRAPERVSSFLETPAWGFEGPDFLNCVACYELEKPWTPTRLLNACQAVERKLGRRGGPEWDENGRRIYRDRPIDIDILLWGDRRIHTTRLDIPHPLMAQRDFVMIPLREIADEATKRAFPEIFGGK